MVHAIDGSVIADALGPGPSITDHQQQIIDVLVDPRNHPSTDVFSRGRRSRPLTWLLREFESFGRASSDPIAIAAGDLQTIGDILANYHHRVRTSSSHVVVAWGGDDAPDLANNGCTPITGCEVLVYIEPTIALQEHIPLAQLVSPQGLTGLRRAIEIGELLDNSYQRLMEVAESHGLLRTACLVS